jgi:translation initiation factor 2 beta subunit (eIF-2beta)/eIF-5
MIDNESVNFEIEKYIETLKKCEYIQEKEVKFLCDKAKEILIKEENVVYLNSPITVNFD